MLARRFTIICLMLTLFSMFFAGLVAQASRSSHSWDRSDPLACLLKQNALCGDKG